MPIENTTLQGERGWTMGGNPKAIARQEKAGQQQLVADRALPVKGLLELPAEWGIEFERDATGNVKVRERDPLFADVKLPPGWSIRATEHDMWTELFDAEGVKRASIFYKAAYYDRDAFIRAGD